MTAFEIILNIIHFLAEGVLILFGWLLVSGSSYFSKKGENKAMEEDIEKLTQLAESIKTKLEYSLQTRVSIKSEERNAVVDCYEKYHVWLNTILDSSLVDISVDNEVLLISEMKSKLSASKFHFEIAQSKMQLFVNNKTLSETVANLKLSTSKLHLLNDDLVIKLIPWLSKMRQYNTSNGYGVAERGQLEALLAEKQTIFDDFFSEKIKKYEAISDLNVKFTLEAYKHIQALLTETPDLEKN